MSSFAATLVPTVTARRRFAPYTATPSYNTRARTDTKDTQDAAHDAALSHSLHRPCSLERSGSEIEDGYGCARDVGAAGDARPPPAYPGGAERSTRHPRGAPFDDGSARSGSRPTPREASHGRPRIHPTSHSHRARRRHHARLSFISDTSPSSTSDYIRDSDASTLPPPPINRGRGLVLKRRVGGGGGTRGAGLFCSARAQWETAWEQRGASQADVDVRRRRRTPNCMAWKQMERRLWL
ncbi:hypothetical protein DFH09DRAFT_1367080 [Mycena vulgaris]|nr:hypothetical protein DFH09DRAFT_1367080 [Mycena vulgaris]